MSLIQANCKNCGANLEFDDSEEKYFCSKCGTQYIYERPVSVTVNIGSIPVDKGYGRTNDAIRINEKKYAMPFDRDEQRVKQDWLFQLMSFEDVPLDVASKAKIVSIKKEYYPLAFYDVTSVAEWRATSIWEHKEQYQVPRQETVYYDSYGKEHSSNGFDIRNGQKINYRPMSRTVYDTKTRIVTDNIQQTNGSVPPTNIPVQVWVAPVDGKNISSKISNWINLDSKFVEINDNYLNDYVRIPEDKSVDESFKLAKEEAQFEIEKIASNDVPGTRYEDFSMSGEVVDVLLTYRYLAVYHIIYSYNGIEYECFITGGLNDNDNYFVEHPVDEALQNRISSLRKKAESIVTWPWTFAIIFAPIPLGVIGWGMAAPVSSTVGKVLMWLLILAVYVSFIVVRVVMGLRESATTQDLNALISRNDRLKKQFHDLLKDESISDESKAATLEKWVLDSDVELQNTSATTKAKKKIIITIASCLGALLILGIGVVAFNAIKESKAKAKAIAESKAKVEAEENAQNNARDVVEGFLKAVKANDSEKYKTYLASDCKDPNGLLNFLSPESMNEGICSYDKITPNQLSQESLKQLTNSSAFFCKNFIASYDSLEIKTDDNGTCTVKVPGKIINMQTFSNVYVSKLYELAQIINSKYADSLTEIQNTSKTQAEYTSRFYDLVIADICRAYEETVKEAGTVDVTFTFVVKEVSGEYVITEINY